MPPGPVCRDVHHGAARYITGMAHDLRSVQVYLPHEVWDVVAELADLGGESRSALVRDLLVDAVPMMRALIDAARTIEAAGDLRREAFADLADRLEVHKTRAEEVFGGAVAEVRRLRPVDPPPLTGGSEL